MHGYGCLKYTFVTCIFVKCEYIASHKIANTFVFRKPSVSSNRYKLACVSFEDLDQHAPTRSLTRVFDEHSTGCQGCNVSTPGQLI